MKLHLLRTGWPSKTVASPPPLDCPYRGLEPYTEADRTYFFGRDEDQETIAANLLTAPLTILYGASGVGKTSVLLAGVVPLLSTTSDTTVIVFRAWQHHDVLTELTARVADAVARNADQTFSVDGSPLDELLARAVRASQRPLAIIFDQFEEYFVYHGREDGAGTFAAEFARAINRQDGGITFLIAIREDALARLDHFKGRIPYLFDNYLRIENLDRESAERAIEEPVARYNELHAAEGSPMQVEPALVETVLDQIQIGKVVLGEAGRGGISADVTNGRVETPYLQLVMTRLWTEETRAGSRILRLETLNRLGGTEVIVRTHLDEVMAQLTRTQRDVCADLFHFMVTPSGSKIAYTANDLAEYTGVSLQRVEPVLQDLTGSKLRLIRPVRTSPTASGEPIRYEIFHDRLAPAVLDWSARYQRDALVRRRRLTILGVGLLVVVLLLTFALIWYQAQEARFRSDLQTLAFSIAIRDGYTPSQPPGSAAADYSRDPLWVVLGVKTSSQYDQRAFFFVGLRYLGTDTFAPSAGLSFVSRTDDTVTLRYARYEPGDNLCCPSDEPAMVRYFWNGEKLVPLDPIPPTAPDASRSRR